MGGMKLTDTHAKLLFGAGAKDALLQRWLEACTDVLHQTHISLEVGQVMIARLFAMFDDLLAGLDESFSLFKGAMGAYQTAGKYMEVCRLYLPLQ